MHGCFGTAMGLVVAVVLTLTALPVLVAVIAVVVAARALFRR